MYNGRAGEEVIYLVSVKNRSQIHSSLVNALQMCYGEEECSIFATFLENILFISSLDHNYINTYNLSLIFLATLLKLLYPCE